MKAALTTDSAAAADAEQFLRRGRAWRLRFTYIEPPPRRSRRQLGVDIATTAT